MIHRITGVRRATLMLVAAAAALLVFASVGLAGSTGKIKNGNFETGSFTPGWTADCASCLGDFFVSDKKQTPIQHDSWFGPMEKEYEAVSDQGAPDTDVLYQELKIGSKNTRLTFDLEWNNRAGVWCNPGDLDFTSDCGVPSNQQIRVFIQNNGDDPFTDPALKVLWQSTNSTPFKQGKTKVTANLGNNTGDLQLVFAVVAGYAPLNLGVDEVAVNNG